MRDRKDRRHRGMASATSPGKHLISQEEKGCSPLEVGALSLAQACIPQTEEENAHGEVYRADGFVVRDAARVKNRLKSVYRSRGVWPGKGRSVYGKGEREGWLAKLPEARKHREWHVVKTCPGLGPIRTAELLPVVVTPYRFRSRSGFWAYCGLGIVMRSSSDWVRTPTGAWIKAAVQQTRGLNRNFNHTLKRIFKGAATTVIGRAEDEPLYHHYERLLDGGTKPNLAKLTLARQIAAIAMAVWRSGEAYDPKRLEATK